MPRKVRKVNTKSRKHAIKAPRFTGLKPASTASSRAKKANRSTDTEHEKLLRSELFRLGLRFRKNIRDLPGNPDVVFQAARVVVFCDGDFWHGNDWPALRAKLKKGTNAEYWLAKIKTNMQRDRRKTVLLEQAGWHVIRCWESDIKRDSHAVAASIKKTVMTCRTK